MMLGQLLGHDLLPFKLRPVFRLHFALLAEREEFELNVLMGARPSLQKP
jgi:hypothetical protein